MYRNFEDNMILVIDDFINEDYQEKIKKVLTYYLWDQEQDFW